jgi:hypothetical protein
MKIKPTWKLMAVLFALACTTSAVLAVMVANWVIPSTVTITAAPGIEVFNADGTGLCNQISWGDLQKGTTKTWGIFIKNTKGTMTLYIIPTMSLVAHNLPSGVVLSWTLDQTVALQPGQQTTIINLQLTATDNAQEGGPYNFSIEIKTFDTAQG